MVCARTATGSSFMFAMSHIPMLMKHGLAIEGAKGA